MAKYLFVHGHTKFSNLTVRFIEIFTRENVQFDYEVLCLSPSVKDIVHPAILKNKSVRYINEFNPSSLLSYIKSSHFNLVIMYDDAFLMNIVVSSISRSLGINSLNIQHGVFSPSPARNKHGFALILKKVSKYVGFVRYYWRYCVNDRSDILNLMTRLLRMFTRNESVLPSSGVSKQLCDYTAVWDSRDIDVAVNLKNYQPDKVFVVGSPDSELVREVRNSSDITSNVIWYIHQPILELGLVSKKTYFIWASTLKSQLRNDYQLHIRPHPKSDIVMLKEFFPEAVICSSIPNSIGKVLGHFSSLNYMLKDIVPNCLVFFDEIKEQVCNSRFENCKKIHHHDYNGLQNFLRNESTVMKIPEYDKVKDNRDFYKNVLELVNKIT